MANLGRRVLLVLALAALHSRGSSFRLSEAQHRHLGLHRDVPQGQDKGGMGRRGALGEEAGHRRALGETAGQTAGDRLRALDTGSRGSAVNRRALGETRGQRAGGRLRVLDTGSRGSGVHPLDLTEDYRDLDVPGLKALPGGLATPLLLSRLDDPQQGGSAGDGQGAQQGSAGTKMCDSDGPVNVTISYSKANKYTWKGWGTSLAWFANYIGGLPEAQRATLLDYLFDKTTGLGLNIVRYNIGGGFDPAKSPQFTANNPIRFRGMPGFKPGPDAPYDWSSDANQRAVLLGARDRGADTFEAFSNSPPHWMTISGDVAGNWNGMLTNLKSDSFEAFANYLADVVQQYATDPDWNIKFDSLDPVNEPTEGWWRAGGTQEGCAFSVEDMARLYPLVAAALQKRGLGTAIVGANSWAQNAPQILNGLPWDVASSLKRIEVHGYASQGLQGVFESVRGLTDKFQKEAWVSEWGPMYSGPLSEGPFYPTDLQPGLSLALNMASTIVQAVNYMGAAAWVHWQALDSHPAWGLMKLAWNGDSPSREARGKSYYALMQFTKLAVPGSTSIVPDASSDCRRGITAFHDPSQNKLTLIFVNPRDASREVRVSLHGFQQADSAQPCRLRLFRTSEKQSFKEVLTHEVDITQPISVLVRERSLSSVLIENIMKSS